MNLSLQESPFVSFSFSPNPIFFTCYNQTPLPQVHDYFQSYRSLHCNISTIYYKTPATHQDHALPIPLYCYFIQRPVKSGNSSADLLHLLTADFTLEWEVSQVCNECHHEGGQCLSDNEQKLYCSRKESFKCGDHTFNFPLTRADNPDCGLIAVDGCDSDDQVIHLGGENLGFSILKYNSSNKILIRDRQLESQLSNKSCFSFMNHSLLRSPPISVSFSPNLTLFHCNAEPTDMSKFDKYFENYSKIECLDTVYYKIPASDVVSSEQIAAPEGCSLVQLPMKSSRNSNDLFSVITANFTLEWDVSDECVSCFNGGGQCLTANNNTFYCERGIVWS